MAGKSVGAIIGSLVGSFIAGLMAGAAGLVENAMVGVLGYFGLPIALAFIMIMLTKELMDTYDSLLGLGFFDAFLLITFFIGASITNAGAIPGLILVYIAAALIIILLGGTAVEKIGSLVDDALSRF